MTSKSYTKYQLIELLHYWYANDMDDKATTIVHNSLLLSAWAELPENFREISVKMTDSSFEQLKWSRECLIDFKAIVGTIKDQCEPLLPKIQPVEIDPIIEATAKRYSRYAWIFVAIFGFLTYRASGIYFFLSGAVTLLLIACSSQSFMYDNIVAYRNGKKKHTSGATSEPPPAEKQDDEIQSVYDLMSSYLRNETTLKAGLIEFVYVWSSYLKCKARDLNEEQMPAAVRDEIFQKHTDLVTDQFKTIIDEEIAYRHYMLWHSLNKFHMLNAAEVLSEKGIASSKEND